ncbi:MAG TPA: ribosome-associated translation inhibitor RaiA [Eubacteriales bacterium]|jgi:putative sigma-54 modulation protein|nr:ribosome-associated translation inhibitor RaiA [Clostridia bacterium]HRV73781.1 ribosome-associated translation inhibitor RaiA [Eubacteriales bacterium]
MRITISGKNLEVSGYMRDVAVKKLSKLDKYFPEDVEAQVTLSVERNRHIVEVTIPYEGRIIRGEEVSDDMYASFDNVLAKLEKQIVRHRTKFEKDHRGEGIRTIAGEIDEDEDYDGPRIVRVKKFDIKPMSEEEAMMQLELLGHSFFVFRNAETNQINVLYVRKDGNYGLIEPVK